MIKRSWNKISIPIEVIKRKAIEKCLKWRERAVCRKTKVGAALYTKDSIIGGYNLENKSHKGYHAEEVAILHARLQNINPDEIQGIVVSFSGKEIINLTFMCGHCRQIVWEFTLNPDLLVTEVDAESGKIVKEVKLGKLYPYPYPRKECAELR